MKIQFQKLLLSLLFVSQAPSVLAQGSMAAALASQQLLRSGRDVYLHNCAGCHGINAMGDGPAAKSLEPRPRNLMTGSFKFRSTPSGTLPTVGDLIRTIDQGVWGTSMPSFRLMSSQEKLAVATYIVSLRDWKENAGDPIFIPRPPMNIFGAKATLLASATRGYKTYLEACQTCHGDQGQGNGPSVEGLMDSDDRPIVPANLQKRYIKSGRTPSDIYKAISTGLDGTPMPGFGDAFTDAEKWDLVAFVFYLRGVGSGVYTDELFKQTASPTSGKDKSK